MNHNQLSQPATKIDIEVAIAQIVQAVTKSVASKDDIKDMATKDDIKILDSKMGELNNKVDGIDDKVDNITVEVKDIRRRMTDLEHGVPSQKDVDALKKFIGFPGHI